MHQILITCREAAIAAIPLFPIYIYLHKYRIQNIRRSLIYLVFSIYLCAMYAAVGLPDVTYYRYKPHFNFIPFLYMFSAWETTLLNVILFIPLGCFLPTLWKYYHSPIKTVFFGFCLSLAVEVLQIFTYRASDINDLMTNTFGTILGYLLGITILKVFPGIASLENRKDMLTVFGVSFLVMFTIYPFLCILLI